MNAKHLITVNEAPITVMPYDSATIAHTSMGNMILTLQNVSCESEARVVYTSGHNQPETIIIPPGYDAPMIVVNNWNGKKLTVTNTSVSANVKVGLFGFGSATHPLPIGTPVNINQFESIGGYTKDNYMELKLSSSSQYSVIYVFSLDNQEPVAYCLNAPEPDKVPVGWIATSSDYYIIQRNWTEYPLFLLNASPYPGVVEALLTDLA